MEETRLIIWLNFSQSEKLKEAIRLDGIDCNPEICAYGLIVDGSMYKLINDRYWYIIDDLIEIFMT